ncbi:TPA: LysR family transcriptional regulator [Klebsiella pneumoniae]|nr:LysR family transcriptional regulator [Klebsiella pneumoniae]
MLKRKHDKIINIMQLRFFCQVALRGSVSRAADDLFRTQSAITRAIRDLEAALNVTLFERHYSGMVPTEYGKCILPRARRAIDDLQAIPALLQKHHTRSSGPLAAVSASQMRFETDNGLLSVLPVPLPDTTRRIGLTFRAGSLPSPATQALLRFIYQQVQDGAV